MDVGLGARICRDWVSECDDDPPVHLYHYAKGSLARFTYLTIPQKKVKGKQ